jgi:hypothetical protein
MTIFSGKDIDQILEIVRDETQEFFSFFDEGEGMGSSDMASLYRTIILSISGLDIWGADRDKVSSAELQMIRNAVSHVPV